MFNSITTHQKSLIAFVWVSIFWGTTWIASRVGVRHMPALQMIGLRQLISGIVFIAWFMFRKHPLPKDRQWAVILALSTLNFMLSNGFVIWGVRYISSGLGAIIGAIFPLWLVIIIIARGNKLPIKAITGMLVGFAGICIIFYDHLLDFLDPGFRFGIFLSVTGSVTWAFATLYTKQKANDFNPYYSLGFQMAISGIVFLCAAALSGNVYTLSQIPAVCWWSIAYLVLVGSALTFVAYIYALRHMPAALVSVYAYINPIVAVILGTLLLEEKLNGFIVVGGFITIAGVFLVNESFRKKGAV